MAKRWKLTVTSDASQLSEIGRFVHEIGLSLGLDPDSLFDVELACEEACANVIEHAYHAKQGVFSVSCCANQGDFVVEIEDFGASFNPLTVSSANTRRNGSSPATSGYGIQLMRQLMDQVTYQFDDKAGNRLTMIKHNVVPPSEQEP